LLRSFVILTFFHYQNNYQNAVTVSLRHFVFVLPVFDMLALSAKQSLPKSSKFIRAALLFTGSFAVEFPDEKPEATISPALYAKLFSQKFSKCSYYNSTVKSNFRQPNSKI